MKYKLLLIFQVLVFVAVAQTSNRVQYYKSVNKAQSAFIHQKYDKSSKYYLRAFKASPPFWKDLEQAIKVELDYGDADKTSVLKYMQYIRLSFSIPSGEKLWEIVNLLFPKLKDLEYIPEIKDFFQKAKAPVFSQCQFKDEINALFEKDQQIRDSVMQITNSNDIYRSEYANRIKQVDSLNLMAILEYMKDYNLNERDSKLINQIEVMILHSASNGKLDWLEPLNQMLKEGRVDVRRYVRIIDEAWNTPVKTILKKRGLLFGSFNGIRLYNLMYFTKPKGRERSLIKKNRKKVGYISLKQEIDIKSWQYIHKDEFIFYPFISLIPQEDAYNQDLKSEFLEEQNDILEEAKKKHKIKIVRL